MRKTHESATGDGTFAVSRGAVAATTTPHERTRITQDRTTPQLAAPDLAVHQGWAQGLISETDALIAAYAACRAFANQAHPGAVSDETIRTLITTVYIRRSRSGREDSYVA